MIHKFIDIFTFKILAFLIICPSRLSAFWFSLSFVRTPDIPLLFKFSTSHSTLKSSYFSVDFIYHTSIFSVCHANKLSSLGFYLFLSLVSIWNKMNYLEISQLKRKCFFSQHLECLSGQNRWIDWGIYYLFISKHAWELPLWVDTGWKQNAKKSVGIIKIPLLYISHINLQNEINHFPALK